MATRERVRDRVVDREELAVERPEAVALPSSTTSSISGFIRCSASLARSSARVKRLPTIGRSGRSRSRNGTAPMWSSCAWVRIDGLDVVQPVPDRAEVRKDQVDAGLVGLREEHAAVDDQQPAGVLEDGHVAADLAEAAEGDHPQPVLRRAGGGAARSGCGWLMQAAPARPPRSRRAARRSARASHRRGAVAPGRHGRPSSCSAALVSDDALGAEEARVDRHQLVVQRDGASRRHLRRRRRCSSRICGAKACPTTLTDPAAPTASSGRLSTSSPE